MRSQSSSKYPYRPFYQLPYCCVPATLQWILYHHGLDILDQETIGAELGLRLPTKAKTFFTHPDITYLDIEPRGGFGTQIEKSKFSINQFFAHHLIPLQISNMTTPKNTAALSTFVSTAIDKGNDVILRYFKTTVQKGYGHFSLIMNQSTSGYEIGDPDTPFFRTMDAESVLLAISNKHDGITRGLYIVSRTG